MKTRINSLSVTRFRAVALAAMGAALAIVLATSPVGAQSTYQKPPKAILDVMDAPVIPTGTVDPSGHFMVLYRSVGYPTIADMAQPMLRLAGLRINPLTSATHNSPAFTDFVVKSIPDGVEHKVVLPEGGRFGAPR